MSDDTFEEGFRAGLIQAAALASEHADAYPPDIFVGEVGKALRWKCELIASEIRALIPPRFVAHSTETNE